MDDVVETAGEDTTNKDAPEVAEDFDSTEAEFRSLFQRCDQESSQMKQLAMQLQPSAPQAAEALRQVAGNVYPMIQEVIATCGGAMQSLEETVEDDAEGGVGLTEEDAVDFARTLMANTKMIVELCEAATDDAVRERLDALKAMNDEMHERVLELAEMDQAEMEKALSEPDEPTTPEATEVN